MISVTDVSLAGEWAAGLDADVRNELRSLLLRIADRVEEPGARVETVHMNGAEDLPLISGHGKDARVTGLDALLAGDYASAFAKLLAYSDEIEFCPGDAFGCATALAAEFVRCGGRRLAVSFLGIGGRAPLEEVLLALRVTRRWKPGLDLTVLAELRDAFELAGAERAGARKPVVGRRIFHVESGIHVDGVLKNPANYEPFSPETVGLSREICLGKHSGMSSVAYKLRELGVAAGAADIGGILRAVRERSAEFSRGVSDDEFREMTEYLNEY
jgi:homocitrate synthase NifV